MIAILCPTRGRPEQFRRMRDSLRSTQKGGAGVWNYVYGMTSPQEYQSYVDLLGVPECSGYHLFQAPENMPTVHKWNTMADFALQGLTNSFFMLGADDIIFETSGWDEALINHYNSLENKIHVYALQDSRDADGTPHVICTREYIEAMGYFLPPIFLHWNVDTWTVEIAKANNCFTHFRDFTLRHEKPSDRGQPDETHSRIRQWGWHERDKWVAEKMAHVLEVEKARLSMAFLKLKDGILVHQNTGMMIG